MLMCKFIQNQYIYLGMIVLMLLLTSDICRAEFTIEDENKLGREFYEQLEQHQMILHNKVLTDYITGIGNLILDQTTRTPFKFNFFILDSSAINAFATPGGYIYINKGLLLVAENEAQLAGVIAHEIGHANARHVASIISKSQKLNMAALAAMLAGVFLGGGGEASAAITAFSLAGSSSMTLRYMREHEEEADRLGIDYLVHAGYNPSAMVDFLKIMKQYEFLSKTMPSYLQTHPGTDDRIIYMDGLIMTRYRQPGKNSIIGNLCRVQASVPLSASELSRRQRQLETSLAKDPQNTDLLYNLAMIEDQLGANSSALEHLQKALVQSPDDHEILKSIGLLHLKTGRYEQAQNYLLRAKKSDPRNDEITFALGKTYFSSGKYREALDCFLNIRDRASNEAANLNYFTAMSYGKLQNKGESHYYFGLHFKQANKKDSALFHFREALIFFPPGSERNAEIHRAVKELTAGKDKQKRTIKKDEQNSFL